VNACAGVSTENLEKTGRLHLAVGHEFDYLARQRDELIRQNRIIREQHAEVVKQLIDPIVRAKMLEPSPPIFINTDYEQVKRQRDELLAALEPFADIRFPESVFPDGAGFASRRDGTHVSYGDIKAARAAIAKVQP
jgi:hypothetical protein